MLAKCPKCNKSFHLNIRDEYGDFIVNLCYKCWLEEQKVEELISYADSLDSLDDAKKLLNILTKRIKHLNEYNKKTD